MSYVKNFFSILLISVECNEIDLTDEEGKCQCFDNAMFRIDSFKTLEYQMATPEGTVAKKCFDAFKDAAPKVTKQYRECISALQCEYLSVKVITALTFLCISL